MTIIDFSIETLFQDAFKIRPEGFCCFSGICIGGVGGFGVTAGAHRLWTHRTYKAKLPLRILLAACYSSAGQVNPACFLSDRFV